MGEGRGSRRGWRLVLLVAVASTTGAVHARMDTGAAAEAATLRAPEPRLTKLLAQGFAPVVADWYWVQVLQIVGGASHEVSKQAEAIGETLELITDLDPWVDHPYRFAGIWLTGSESQVLLANRLLEKSLSYHPRDWRNRFYLGYNQFFYLGENAAAARTLEPALYMSGAPDYLGPLVARLRADGGDLRTAQIFLQELIRTAPDEYARAEYLKAHDEIETELLARMLDRARAAFVLRNGRDVHEPAELWQGSLRVMSAMPPPHPHFPGFHWTLDPASGEIVSTFYKTRYRLHIQADDAERRARWRGKTGTSQERAG